MKLLVDGENLRHQIAHVLYENGTIVDKNAYFSFDMIGFFRETLHDREIDATYFTTRIRQPYQKVPFKLQKTITAISESNRKWIADITNQGIKVEKAGYLRVRESSACIHCGKKTLILQEKGVDVRVATELVLAAGMQKKIVLVSSDSDLTPAMAAAKAKGLHVTYLCYAGWLNRSVAAEAYKTVTFDDALVLKYFRGK